MILGNAAFFIGTGILISSSILKESNGWHWYMPTEDLEFAVFQLIEGKHAYFCYEAVFYDEKYEHFSDFKKQSLRWAGGYTQVLRRY